MSEEGAKHTPACHVIAAAVQVLQSVDFDHVDAHVFHGLDARLHRREGRIGYD